MKGIRKFLTKVLGVEKYLFLISRIYIRLISMGLLKKKYPEIHFLKTIVQPNYVSLDIGANLGYYSTAISRLSPNGKVFCVEPMPPFIKVWKRNTKSCKNVELLPFALGKEDTKVKMVIPIVDGLVRHGLSKVTDDSSENSQTELNFTVEMKKGDALFSDVDHIDFMKCDIEGHEQFAVASLMETITKHRPIIQIELGGNENRQNVYSMLTEKNFKAFILNNNALHPIDEKKLLNYAQDFYFICTEKIENYSYVQQN